MKASPFADLDEESRESRDELRRRVREFDSSRPLKGFVAAHELAHAVLPWEEEGDEEPGGNAETV